MATVVVSARDVLAVEMRRCGLSWGQISGYTRLSRSGARLVVARFDSDIRGEMPLAGAAAMLQTPNEPSARYAERLVYGTDYSGDEDTNRQRRRRLWAALCKYHGANELACMRADRILRDEWYG